MKCGVVLNCVVICGGVMWKCVKSGGVMQHSDVEWYLVKCGDVVW